MLMRKEHFRKFISLSMALLFAASSASCSSKKHEDKIIKESDTWYGCNSFEISNLYPKDKYDYSEFETAGTIDDCIYMRVQAMKSYEGDNKNMTEEEYLNSFETSILKFSFDGELLEKTDYHSVADNGVYRVLQKAWVSDGRLNTLEENYVTDTGKITYFLNGEEITVSENKYDYYYQSLFIDDIYTINGYTLYTSGYHGASLNIINPDGSVDEIYLYEAVNGGVEQTGRFIQGENGTVILPVYTSSYEEVFISIDPVTKEVTELEGLYGTSGFWVEYASGKSIARDFSGFNLVDQETGELTLLFEYNDVDESLSDIMEAECFYVSENGDELILGIETAVNTGSYTTEWGYKIMHLSKAASNPNAGKTELILTTTGDYYFPDESDFHAIRQYNKSNGSYFIKYIMPYEGISDDMPVYKDVDADIFLAYEPSMDPSDSNRYIDLAQYIDLNSDSFREEYFTNAVDAAKAGDALYRVPLDISAEGILTASSNVPQGQKGFTFDSYVKFVDEICNGTDPMTKTAGYKMGKAEYFTRLFTNMSELFIYDGKVHLDGDDFRALAEYVDKYGTEDAEIEQDEYYDSLIEEHNLVVAQVMEAIDDRNAQLEGRSGAVYGNLYSFDTYVDCYLLYGNGIGMYGLPSFDGRGPMTVSHCFVSVSAATNHPEACADFVKLLLSYDIQKTRTGNPINRKALRTDCEEVLAEYNRMLSNGGLSYYHYSGEVPEEAIDNYINILSSSYGGMNAGSAIEDIIREEAYSYFSGGRSLDDVIPVMQKRIQTVLDENK